MEEIDAGERQRPSVELVRLDSHGTSHAAESLWGVNVGGFLQSELGIGEAARAVISALDAGEVPVHADPRCVAARKSPGLPVRDARHERSDVPGQPDMRQRRRARPLDPRGGYRLFRRYISGSGGRRPANGQRNGSMPWTVWTKCWWGPSACATQCAVETVPVTKITVPVWMPTPAPRSRAELGHPRDSCSCSCSTTTVFLRA